MRNEIKLAVIIDKSYNLINHVNEPVIIWPRFVIKYKFFHVTRTQKLIKPQNHWSYTWVHDRIISNISFIISEEYFLLKHL